MDESGFAIGTELSSRVIVDGQKMRTRYKVQPGRQEWVLAVECVCTDGTALSLLLIFKE